MKILGLQPRISKVFPRSLEQFFLTVGQNNFGYKTPKLYNLGQFYPKNVDSDFYKLVMIKIEVTLVLTSLQFKRDFDIDLGERNIIFRKDHVILKFRTL